VLQDEEDDEHLKDPV